jgi:hypothetical protein
VGFVNGKTAHRLAFEARVGPCKYNVKKPPPTRVWSEGGVPEHKTAHRLALEARVGPFVEEWKKPPPTRDWSEGGVREW